MKKTLLFVLIITIIISCCGCSLSKESVNLASKSEILRYAKKNFGSATVESVEKTDSKIKYTLKDNTYEFEYFITSTVSGVGMDGTSFWYKETKVTDYDFQFFNYIVSSTEVQELMQDAQISMENCRIYTTENTNLHNLKSIIIQIGEVIHRYDKKNVFENEIIFIEDTSGKWIGSYDYSKQAVTIYEIEE